MINAVIVVGEGNLINDEIVVGEGNRCHEVEQEERRRVDVPSR
jgi:hypothetical protein